MDNLDFGKSYRLSSLTTHFKKNGKVLLINTGLLRPLLVRRDDNDFLGRLLQLSQPQPLKCLFPETKKYSDILKMLIDHKIIEPNSQDMGNKDTCSPTDDVGLEHHPPAGCDGKGKHLAVYLLTSHDCNHACKYCLAGRNPYGSPLYMTDETGKRALEMAIGSASPEGDVEIIFFGGEPMLNWSLAKELMNYYRLLLRDQYPSVRTHFHITTNLSILPDDFISVAEKNQLSVLTDIDGPREIHDRVRRYRDGASSYDDICRNIKALCENGISVATRSTVTSVNDKILLEIALHNKELGSTYQGFPCLIPFDSAGELVSPDLFPSPEAFCESFSELLGANIFPYDQITPMKEALDAIQSGGKNYYGCGMPLGNTIVVDATGRLYPCIYLVGHEKYYLGSVCDLDKPKELSRLLENFFKKQGNFMEVDNIEGCKMCSKRYFCCGGCALAACELKLEEKELGIALDYLRRYTCVVSSFLLEQASWITCGEPI